MTLEIRTKDNIERIFLTVDTSWLEYFPKFNKQVVQNKNVLGGKSSKN